MIASVLGGFALDVALGQQKNAYKDSPHSLRCGLFDPRHTHRLGGGAGLVMNGDRMRAAELLGKLKGFSSLPSIRIKQLAAEMTLVPPSLRTGVFILDRKAWRIYLVLRGVLKIVADDYHLGAILGAGDVFGPLVFASGSTEIVRYVPIKESIIGSVSPERFAKILFGISTEDFPRAVDFLITNWWGGAMKRSPGFFRLPLQERLSQVLADVGARFGVRNTRGLILNVPLTHQDFADLVGATRPRVTTQLAAFERSGVIVREGRKLVLVNHSIGAGARLANRHGSVVPAGR